MCLLAQVSRASYYRWLARKDPPEEDMTVRQAIQEIALANHRRYGYRRITVALRRRGLLVNKKRVQKLMQQDNLLHDQKKHLIDPTTCVSSFYLHQKALKQQWLPVPDLNYNH